jgi:MFS superfamily sulfate permease-like transporter
VKRDKSNNNHLRRIIKDAIIIAMIFIVCSFIDVLLACFVTAICTSILLTRRVILSLNPGFIRGHKISLKGKTLSVSKGIDVFDLNNSESIESLYKYIEVICNIAIPPKILIIRFSEIFQVKQFELHILNKVIKRFGTNKISIILSDVRANVQHQLRQNGIAQKIGEENIFYYITDALNHANEILHD